ncbi:hypothetical protein AKJ50_01240 [candidate division MSBL1 archaeon SCGC-AAA382A13]|uniref:Aldehyde ferredoxin oxidoreductase N-terminal domain-containing protein n=1 Tax=candidate division MSBL1 archaeon SCGC-AAA382A13 TaxID=1698279 RepID=A0A133VFX5_9EURY|nr:hypothetical protein AKJ50_01240 [candidate division MSBL1 archaeon SCGC-AAA382A13]
MKGLFGKFLDVNLSDGDVRDYSIPEEWCRKYLGGRGLGARILLEELDGGEDALDEENILIFASGPLQGTGIPGAGRHVVLGKSPKTGSVNDSYAGGFFGHELAKSGYDGIIVRGRSDYPCYISIVDGEGKIDSADELWELDVAEVEKKLKNRHDGGRVTSIGIGGENLVKFACIMNDRSRAAGRPGFGAVMGSKKLKAILVRGDFSKPIHDREKLKEARTELVDNLSPAINWGKYGSSGAVEGLNEMGVLPTKNFQEGVFEGAEKISGGRMYDEILTERDTCAGCPVRCKRVVSTEFDGEEVEEEYGGPEYETIAAFGSFCLNDNLDSIALANQKCNKYGLDTISTGNTIAFAMEASEKDLIDRDLEWGDPDQIIELVEKIAHRKGLGDRLAEGIDLVSEEMDADFAMHVKNQEIPMHEPRGKNALALSYATTPRGANHMEVFHDTFEEHPQELKLKESIDRFDLKSKPKFNKMYEELISFSNSAIICAYTGWVAYFRGSYTYPQIRKSLKAITGIEINKSEMLTIGERNFNLLKLLAEREKISRKKDKLPDRFFEALPRGPSSGKPISRDELQKAIDEYYDLRGWDEYGPTKEKLKELDMDGLRNS